jgi:iron complex transport system substrate-binding protein
MKKMTRLGIQIILMTLIIGTGLQSPLFASPQKEPASPAASASQAAPASRTITDMGGTAVTLPGKVEKVIDLWHANNQVVLLLGGADTLVGTTSVIKGLPWYAKVYPGIADVKPYVLQNNTGGYNTEEILMARPDVVITSSPQDAEVLRNAGITAAMVTFRDFDGLKKCVSVTADVLGGDAPARAEEYLRYLESNMKRVSDRVASIPENQRLKVYEVRSANPLDTDGRESICTEWLRVAGAINAIADVAPDNQTTVTMETILKANPDVIIVALQNAAGANGSIAVMEKLRTDPAWSTVTAVKNNRI